MESSVSGSFLPDEVTGEEEDCDGEGGYGLCLEEEGNEQYRTDTFVEEKMIPLASEEPIVAAEVLRPFKSAIKKTSSYGNMEDLGTDIPVCTKRKSWSVLPAPSSIKRSESTASFFRNHATEDSSRIKRNVSFSKIHVRDYSLTIGDNPSCLYGTPVSLGWAYVENEAIDLNAYEGGRPQRRSMRQMHLNSFQRKHILTAYQHSSEEIRAAKQNAAKVRRQREMTKHTLPLMKLEDMLESAGRKAKRMLSGRDDAKSEFSLLSTTWSSMDDLTIESAVTL